MTASSHCQQCGALLPLRALGGLCPRCVGRRLLAPLPPASDADATGLKCGRYHLAKKLGEGGGGIVYLAEQEEPVRRTVALKLLKPGMDSRAVIARFEAERQALAMMDHPNIAKVFDAGTTDTGRPYIVMEFVPGIRLTDFCAQHRLPLAARLELFITVCQAVQHAHQKGVIHRDLKPSNILVAATDAGPAPKVIDFGIAKAVEARLADATAVTELNQLLGTPAYMSPEQLEFGGRDVDTRSDLYSLGVVLYELLTGTTPFDTRDLLASGYDALRRAILETEPVRPTKRAAAIPHLPVELDWIVMKCLEKDRARRYETAIALAQDLRRHLDDEPVTAIAPSMGYQFRKFARRHRVAFAMAGSVAVILLAATGLSVWQAVRASTAETIARQRLVESEAARTEAEVVSKFLTDILQSPAPSQAGRAVTVVELLDRTARTIEADAALPPARRVKLQATLGATYRSLGHYREAIALFEKVREHRRAFSGPEHADTLDAMRDLAIAYHDATRRDEALRLCQEIADLRGKLHGPFDPKTLLARSHLAWSHQAKGQFKQAIEIEEEVLPASRAVNGPEHPDTVLAMSYLGWFYHMDKRPQDAMPLQKQSLELIRRRHGPEHPDTLNALTALAESLNQAKQHDQAIELLRQAVPLSQRTKGASHPETLWAMGALADAHGASGRWADATRAYEEILSVSQETNGTNHARTLWALRRLAAARQANRPR